MSFKVGDVVQLKSGGPPMTVSSVSDGQYWCRWYSKTHDKFCTEGHINPEELKTPSKRSVGAVRT